MSQEQNKKTLRHFQCRDYLWEVFEEMSGEIECSIDYLINESMRQYARSRNYGAKSSAGSVSSANVSAKSSAGSVAANKPGIATSSGQAAAATPSSAGQARAVPQKPVAAGPSVAPQIAKPKAVADNAKTGAYPAVAPAARSYGTAGSASYPSGNQGQSVAPASATNRPPAGGTVTPSSPPPLPRVSLPPNQQTVQPAAAAGALPPLFVEFNGERFAVTKEEFVIGRSSKTADLAIKDGNVSRRHAAVVFRGGRYFIQDLGSTNGVEYQGQRVESKPIDDGDIVQICDYELKFSFR